MWRINCKTYDIKTVLLSKENRFCYYGLGSYADSHLVFFCRLLEHAMEKILYGRILGNIGVENYWIGNGMDFVMLHIIFNLLRDHLLPKVDIQPFGLLAIIGLGDVNMAVLFVQSQIKFSSKLVVFV